MFVTYWFTQTINIFTQCCDYPGNWLAFWVGALLRSQHSLEIKMNCIWLYDLGFLDGANVKNTPANAGDATKMASFMASLGIVVDITE